MVTEKREITFFSCPKNKGEYDYLQIELFDVVSGDFYFASLSSS